MADQTSPEPSAAGGTSKIKQFIKKNKTLSIVIAAVGGYFAWHELNKPQAGVTSGEEEIAEGTAEAAIGGPQNSTEVSHEAIDEEINDTRAEIAEERRDREREAEENRSEHENENKGEGGGAGETQPGGGDSETAAPPSDPGGGGITIHGKHFSGATAQRIAGSGKTDGGKEYIEYVITYPGRQEHWRYFTATGNWSKVNSSADGAGANKPPTGSGKSAGGGGGAGAGGDPSTKPPTSNPNHPDAVNTGNRAINGGVGPHTAPAGYHLFAEGGWIWRAPNVVAVAPAVVAKPSPNKQQKPPVQKPAAPAPAAPPAYQPAASGGHPAAVDTGNKCVKGGVGGHTPPPGWHLYCGGNGNIWRAPN